MRRLIAATLSAVSVSGCAGSYLGADVMINGVQAHRVTSDTIQVASNNRTFASAGKMRRYALRTTAQATIAAGYDLFFVESSSDPSRRITVAAQLPATSPPTPTVAAFGAVAFGPDMTHTSFVPPTTTDFITPGEVVLVKMLKGARPAGAADIYDAHELLGQGRD